MNKTVNIFLVSFYFSEITERVIRRIHEVTKYPFKLIVGDNRSVNSDVIVPKLKKLVDEGLTDELFIYGENYVSSIGKHMFYNTEKADITIITDYDSFISDIDENDCWLTDYVNEFNEDDLMALEKAVEQTVRVSLDEIGLDPDDLKPISDVDNNRLI